MPLDKPKTGQAGTDQTENAPQASLRFCVFGDSHIACIKHAQDEGLLSLDGVVLEYWGAPGPQFRDLHLQDARLVATTAAAQASLAKINPARSTALAPQDYDGFLFIGCRLRSSDYLVPLLRSQPGSPGYLSAAVRGLMLDRWLESCRGYRAAREFAKARPVFFSPAGFLNEGTLSEEELAETLDSEATPEARAALWDEIAQAMAADGVHLLRQPEETITHGGLTRRDYATSLGAEEDDRVHKNGAYGALILNHALSQLPLVPS